MRLTLLTRAYCHLCDEMRVALAALPTGESDVVEIDVDRDPALESSYGERVPVLLLGDPGTGVELCHFRLDAEAVSRALRTC